MTKYMFTHLIDIHYSNYMYMYITGIPKTRYNIRSVLYILDNVQNTVVEKDRAEM